MVLTNLEVSFYIYLYESPRVHCQGTNDFEYQLILYQRRDNYTCCSWFHIYSLGPIYAQGVYGRKSTPHFENRFRTLTNSKWTKLMCTVVFVTYFVRVFAPVPTLPYLSVIIFPDIVISVPSIINLNFMQDHFLKFKSVCIQMYIYIYIYKEQNEYKV